MKKILFVSDVDGCLTDGGMYYGPGGKVFKRFSAGDHEGLKLLYKNGISVQFITADKTGFDITSARMQDMSNANIRIVPEVDRYLYFESLKNDYDYIVFFGDGLADANIKKEKLCNYFICPKQSLFEVYSDADLFLHNEGGHAAFLEASIKFIDYAYKQRLIDKKIELY